MSKFLFILGAGASKEAGAPLMGDFLDVARDIFNERKNPKSMVGGVCEEDFNRIIKARDSLMNIFPKAKLNIDNIEDVFATFEMARIIKKFGNYPLDEIERINNSMKSVIGKTLESTIEYQIREERFPSSPKNYDKFVRLLTEIPKKNASNTPISVITFNYDLALDYAFFVNNIRIDYGLDKTISPNSIPYLKLHGSLNWGKCPQCNQIIPYYLNDYLKTFNGRFYRGEKNEIVKLALFDKIKTIKHCGGSVEESPYFVPPTWNKASYQENLTNVWANAANQLSDVEAIFVIGYSLPDSDYFFKNLYALSTISEIPILKFWVFDPERTGVVEKRYMDLIGESVKPRFKYFQTKFSEAIGIISEEYGINFNPIRAINIIG